MTGRQAGMQLETVVDVGGRCHWCDEPLEPGEVAGRSPTTGERTHEEGCMADALKQRDDLPGVWSFHRVDVLVATC